MDPNIAAALRAEGGILNRREHPGLARKLDNQLARGRLVSPLPGIFTGPAGFERPEDRIDAGLVWVGPDAVVAGRAAARLTFWPSCPVETVELCCPRGYRPPRPGWSVQRRRIPDELIRQVGAARVTSPALTAVDLCVGELGGDIVDRVLRTRSCSLDQLWRALALTPGRRGNRRRAELLHDSRDRPWSEAERLLHRLLRAAGIDGWATNAWIGDEASGYFADVLFDQAGLILEVDGFETHGPRAAFEYDRLRRNSLVLAGYRVLNFTWRQLVEDPDWVIGCVRRALDGTLSPRPGKRNGRSAAPRPRTGSGAPFGPVRSAP